MLFITGYAENAVVGNGHLEPGMQVLTKPFAMDALASRTPPRPPCRRFRCRRAPSGCGGSGSGLGSWPISALGWPKA